MAYQILRITGEHETDGGRTRARVAEVIGTPCATRREADQGIEDLVHQGDDPDTLIVRSTPAPVIGTWLTFDHN